MTMLRAQGIWKSLGGRIVLRDASIALEEGERVVVMGANGSGKSTLLRVIANVIDADEGSTSIAAHATFGFAPENPDLPEHLLVGEWLDTVAALKGLASSKLDLDFGVEALRRMKTRALSFGQRQRVSLAAAWIGAPSFLVLDEPTNALDAETRTAVFEHIRQTTAIVATHDRELAERIATRIVEVEAGVVQTPPT